MKKQIVPIPLEKAFQSLVGGNKLDRQPNCLIKLIF